jgi:hypothetical protein
MFDFEHWCSWAEAESRRQHDRGVIVEFNQGRLSSKSGAAINFKSNMKLFQLAFWVTGEADFYGIDLLTGEHTTHFCNRVLDNASFERTFEECLALIS